MERIPPTLDMTPDGAFRSPPQMRGAVPFSFKLLAGAVLVAVVAGAVSMAALALWLFSMMLPVLIIAGGVAYLSLRYRRWQSLRAGRDLRP